MKGMTNGNGSKAWHQFSPEELPIKAERVDLIDYPAVTLMVNEPSTRAGGGPRCGGRPPICRDTWGQASAVPA